MTPLKIVTTILLWCDHWLPNSEHLLSWTARLFLSCSLTWDLLVKPCWWTAGGLVGTQWNCVIYSLNIGNIHIREAWLLLGFFSNYLTPTLGLVYLQWKFDSKSTKPALSFQAPWGGTRKKSHQISNSVSRSPTAWEFIHDSQAPHYLSAASSVLPAWFSKGITCNARRGALRS